MKKTDLEKAADQILGKELSAKIKPNSEYPILSDSQLKRIQRREIGFGNQDLDNVSEGQFYRVHPLGRPYSKLPRGKRPYFYLPG